MDETEVMQVRIIEMPDRSGQQMRDKLLIATFTIVMTGAVAIWTEKKKIKMAKQAGVKLVQPEYRPTKD